MTRQYHHRPGRKQAEPPANHTAEPSKVASLRISVQRAPYTSSNGVQGKKYLLVLDERDEHGYHLPARTLEAYTVAGVGMAVMEVLAMERYSALDHLHVSMG